MARLELTDDRLRDVLWNVDHAPSVAHLMAYIAALHAHCRHDSRWRRVLLAARERVIASN